MKKLRTVVAGLGRIGWNYHIPNIVRHEGFELAAVADPLQSRLDEAVSKFAIRGYTDFREMIETEKPDLAVIATPTLFHKEQAITAFRNGTDVFLEKPMALNLKEADEIIEVMEQTGRKLMVYQPHRANKEVQAVKHILERDLIGPVYMIKRACSAYIRRNDWQALKKNGGGMLNNYGAHFIDQLLYLAGSPVNRLSCSLNKIASLGDADDVVKMLAVTESGITLDLDINMAAAFPIPEWMLLGERGTVVCEKQNGIAFKIRYYLKEELDNIALDSELAAAGRSYGNSDNIPWREETVYAADFKEIDFYSKCYAYYAMNEEPFVNVKETREVMRVIDECRRDAGWQED